MAYTKTDIGRNIRHLIDTTPHVTIKKLSDHLKIAPSNLSRKLNSSNWDSETIAEVANFFKLPVNSIFKPEPLTTEEPASEYKKEQRSNSKLHIDNNGIRVKIKIEVELEPEQVTRAEEIRKRIIEALK